MDYKKARFDKLMTNIDKILAEAQFLAATKSVKNILTVRNDAKTIKGEKYGVLTGVVYLAPANVSGFEMCPGRTPGCTAACLYTAGHGAMSNVQRGRIRRTLQFVLRRDEFMAQLVKEIASVVELSVKEDMFPAIRLNGTSDVAYEDIPVTRDGVAYQHIFAAFQDVQFYDYTKVYTRLEAISKISNYHVTFSLAETEVSRRGAIIALDLGFSVAAVFEELPERFMGHEVIDGDETDVRFWDDSDGAVIVGLLPKGRAKKDKSGFVIR